MKIKGNKTNHRETIATNQKPQNPQIWVGGDTHKNLFLQISCLKPFKGLFMHFKFHKKFSLRSTYCQFYLLLCFMFLCLFSCKPSTSITKDKSNESKIIAFALDGVTGRIDQVKKTIVVPMPYNKRTHAPYGKNITSITGTMTISKDATVDKQITNPQNYSTQKTYTVTAQDKSTTSYTVVVMVEVTDANRFTVVYDEIKRLEPDHETKAVIDVNLNHLDMFKVTTLKDMFNGMDLGDPDNGGGHRNLDSYKLARKFNGDVGDWNVANVTNMNSTFSAAALFDKPLNWNVSKVKSMISMFEVASEFNQPLNHWKLDEVMNMAHMFYDARKFDKPLNHWNVTKLHYQYGIYV